MILNVYMHEVVNICMYVYMYECTCMYVCMNVHVCMYICMYVGMYVCMNVQRVCMYICMQGSILRASCNMILVISSFNIPFMSAEGPYFPDVSSPLSLSDSTPSATG